jgi:hypothetical protein
MNSSANREGISVFARVVVIIAVGMLVVSCYSAVAWAKEDSVKPRIVPGDGDGVGGYRSSESGETATPGGYPSTGLPDRDYEFRRVREFVIDPSAWGVFFFLVIKR